VVAPGVHRRAGRVDVVTKYMTIAGLAVVLAAAAVLSFAALRDLAIAVRVSSQLAFLLPIAVDAGAAVSCAVWLSPTARPDARRFACWLTWALLVLTVAANAAATGWHALDVTPPWWAAVVVGAIPPGVVGGVVHLLVLVGRGELPTAPTPPPAKASAPVTSVGDVVAPAKAPVAPAPPASPEPAAPSRVVVDERAQQLIAQGVGRRALARELDLSEHAAREILKAARNGHEVLS
jgi:pyruvate/2-oxoglutarate dehydrogenase complex dihydrolipoamide acyltransferase (E2) component